MITNNINNITTNQHQQYSSKTNVCLARARPTSTLTKKIFIKNRSPPEAGAIGARAPRHVIVMHPDRARRATNQTQLNKIH